MKKSLSYDNMKEAVKTIKTLMPLKDFCVKFDLNYDDFYFYEIVPKSIEELIRAKKLSISIATFIIMELGLEMEKKIQIAEWYYQKRKKFKEPIDKLFWVILNYDKFEKIAKDQAKQSSQRELKNLNDIRIREGMKPLKSWKEPLVFGSCLK